MKNIPSQEALVQPVRWPEYQVYWTEVSADHGCQIQLALLDVLDAFQNVESCLI